MTTYSIHPNFTGYADLNYAAEYLQLRLGTIDWDAATDQQKEAALQMAADDLDRLPLIGYRTSREQERRFPRNDETEVPENVKKANVELALEYLKGVDSQEEYSLLTRQEVMYGPIREKRHPQLVEPHIVAGIPSLRAFRYMIPFLRDERSVSLVRT
jgi:hypothetical protein